MFRGMISLWFVFIASIRLATAGPGVTVTVNAAVQYQRLSGFGQAIDFSLVFPGVKESISDALRAEAVEKAFHQVGINMGTIGGLLESPGGWAERQNDDDDPFHINWAGFNSEELDRMKRYVVDLAKPFGFTGYFLGAEGPNVHYHSPWLAPIREHNYNRFLDEAAEQVLANVTYWKSHYDEELDFYQLGNEQASGEHASASPEAGGFGPVEVTRQIVDVVKRAGARLRAAGFEKTRFMVGTEETEEWSYNVASAILADRKAAPYVGAIGYHTYPYQRGYSSVPFILSTSGMGKPDRERIAIRNKIRDLAKAHKVEVWLTENSHAGKAFDYDTFRARAIQIHDEFLYAGISAYFGECAIWDEIAQRKHFQNTDLNDAEGNVVLVHNSTGKVDIASIGYAIGHYARWAKPGSVRIDARSSDALVQVTAFRDDAAGRLALVLINNASEPQTVTVMLKGAAWSESCEGEQSTPAGYWKPLAAFRSQSPSNLQIALPATSVTSIRGKMGDARAEETGK
jgi:O-glycosyl hydrolase